MKPFASPLTDRLTLIKQALGLPLIRLNDERPASQQQPHPGRPPHAAGGDNLELVLEDAADPALLPLWQDLLAHSESAEKLYQSPGFFGFLKVRSSPGQFDLYSLRRPGEEAILALVPVRRGDESIDFFGGRLPRLTPTLNVIRILGSTALIGADLSLTPVIVRTLLARYPDVDAISMPSVPHDSQWWQALEQIDRKLAGVHVWNDWQNCHTIPLPESFEAYMKQFSAKKRYNITRQIKQLETAAGTATVEAVTSAAQVEDLLAAARTVLKGPLLSGWLSAQSYQAMADQGLLLSYVIRCGDTPCGVVLGSTACGVWHIHNIVGDQAYAAFSVGTSVLHLALKHALDTLGVQRIDLGYGKPNRDFNSSHAIQRRGHVLVYRPSLRNHLLLRGHDRLRRSVAAAKPLLQGLGKRVREFDLKAALRRAKPAAPDSKAS
ncbi:MAG: GNAT family N-acetyltransferase [Gammaproteobacteria bacterium]